MIHEERLRDTEALPGVAVSISWPARRLSLAERLRGRVGWWSAQMVIKKVIGGTVYFETGASLTFPLRLKGAMQDIEQQELRMENEALRIENEALHAASPRDYKPATIMGVPFKEACKILQQYRATVIIAGGIEQEGLGNE